MKDYTDVQDVKNGKIRVYFTLKIMKKEKQQANVKRVIMPDNDFYENIQNVKNVVIRVICVANRMM
jgi:hypothetical protein